jgi:competence protein ComEC
MTTPAVWVGAFGFFGGVLVGLSGMPIAASVLPLFLALIFGVFYGLEKKSVYALALIALIFLAGGLVRATVDVRNENETALEGYVSESVEIAGTVASRPEQTSYGQSFALKTAKLTTETASTSVATKIKVMADAYPKVNLGDRIRLNGRIEKPEQFSGDGGRTFDYPHFLAKNEIFYTSFRPEITVIDKSATEENSVFAFITKIRNSLLAEIRTQVPKPYAALAGGVLLGAEDALGDTWETRFQDTGLIHIVVLSGFNVTVVATIIAYFVNSLGLGLRSSTAAAILGIVFFALLVGLTPTVVRASIMAVFALVARVFGRTYAAGRGLLLAMVIMVAVNPHILLYGPSFQLSAMATAGLIVFGDSLSGYLKAVPRRFGLREALVATISAQIAVLPLILFYIGRLSLVSLPANLLVLPVVPVLMAATALVAVGGFLARAVALPAVMLTVGIAGYIFFVVRTLAELPFAFLAIPAFPWWVVVGMYVGGFLLYQYRKNQLNTEKPSNI